MLNLIDGRASALRVGRDGRRGRRYEESVSWVQGPSAVFSERGWHVSARMSPSSRGGRTSMPSGTGGLEVTLNDGAVVHAANVAATSDMEACGPQDLVILGVKAHQIAPIADALPSLFGADTIVLTTQNGFRGGISSATAALSTAPSSTPSIRAG